MRNNDQDPVTITSFIAATPDLVFDACTKEELMRKWLFTGATDGTTSVETTPVPNGQFVIEERDSNNNLIAENRGTYTAIERPHTLEFVLNAPVYFDHETTVSITISAKEEGAAITLVQTGVSRNTATETWKKMFAQLKLTLEYQ